MQLLCTAFLVIHVLLAFLATQGVADRSREARQPFAFALSGGGFRTTTIGMASARAMSQAFEEAGNNMSWEDVTHVGCNSGGNWFMVPFVYSQKFFDEITRKQEKKFLGITYSQDYKSISTIIKDFGRNYSESIQVDNDDNCFLNEETVDFQCPVGAFGSDVTDLVQLLLQALDGLGLGSAFRNWQGYINDMLRPLLADIDTLTYTDRRPAMPHATLIQQLVLPPDAWVDVDQQSKGAGAGAGDGTTKRQQVYAIEAYSIYPFDPIMLPFAHVSKSQSASGTNNVDGFFSPYFGDIFSLKGVRGTSGEENTINVTFTPESRTKVGEVAAISSAAFGSLASPTLLRIALAELFESLERCAPTLCKEEIKALNKLCKGLIDVNKFLDIFLQERNAGRDIPEIVEDIVNCLPAELAGVAPPLTVEPAFGNSQIRPPWTPSFRAIDGGHIENTVIHTTLATFIRDCENGDTTFNCTDKTLDLVLIDDGFLHAFGTQCFFDNSGMNNTCRPAGERMKRHIFWDIPSLQIFSERFPTNWTKYAPRRLWTPEYSKKAVNIQSTISYIQDNFKGSSWTSGIFNTIKNAAYGIKSGYKLRLLIFEINQPITINPILLPPTAGKFTFNAFYTGPAEDQLEGMVPVMTKWLRREI